MKSKLRLIINTGNLFNLDIISTNAIIDPNEEFLEGIRQVLLTSCTEEGLLKQIECNASSNLKCLSPNENLFQTFDRSQLKLSVKLFLYPSMRSQNLVESESNSESLYSIENFCHHTINESMIAIRKLLHTDIIDQLNISIQTSEEDVLIKYLKVSWEAAENVEPQIGSLGTSDLNAEQLQYVLTNFKTKPSTNHINLDGCCDIPTKLNELSKQNNIQLLIHNDPLENYIPVERLQNMFIELQKDSKTDSCKLVQTINPETVSRLWIARYSVVHQSQGLIVSKGYIASLDSSH